MDWTKEDQNKLDELSKERVFYKKSDEWLKMATKKLEYLGDFDDISEEVETLSALIEIYEKLHYPIAKAEPGFFIDYVLLESTSILSFSDKEIQELGIKYAKDQNSVYLNDLNGFTEGFNEALQQIAGKVSERMAKVYTKDEIK